MNKLNLDVDAPDKVSNVLRDAAQAYRESMVELSSSWQDKNAGRIWGVIANMLDNVADRIDKTLHR